MTVIKKKQKRKDMLKSSDAFISAATDTAQWVQEHKQPVIAGIVAIVVVIVGLWGVLMYLDTVAQDSSSLYYAALNIEQADVGLSDANTDQSEMQNVESNKVFASRAEKLTAVEKSYKKIIKEYDGIDVAQLARYRLAVAYTENDQHDKAIDMFQEYLKNTAQMNDNLTFLVREQLGYIYEQKNMLDQAMDVFTEMGDDNGGVYQDASYYHQARILAQKGKIKEAKELFERVSKEFPSSNFKELARMHSALINDKMLAKKVDITPTANPKAVEQTADNDVQIKNN